MGSLSGFLSLSKRVEEGRGEREERE